MNKENFSSYTYTRYKFLIQNICQNQYIQITNIPSNVYVVENAYRHEVLKRGDMKK